MMRSVRKNGSRAMLERELNEWKQASMRPRLFWRDDDAIDVTPALKRLLEMMERWHIPVLLAIIPKFATDRLKALVSSHPLLKPAVHGFSHTNHAGAGEKKSELGDHRRTDVIIRELIEGVATMRGMFGERLSTLLVPPWNRMGEKVTSGLAETGLSGISGFGWKKPATSLLWVNTHIDIINWKNDKKGKSIDIIMHELAVNLRMARENGFSAIGILTHHLVHDVQLWKTLDDTVHFLNEQGNVVWIRTDDLIMEQKQRQ